MADPLWKPISQQEIKNWRGSLPKGWTRESAIGRRVGLDEVESDGDTVAVESPVPSKRREPRETRDVVAKQLLDWAQGSREFFQEKVRFLRAAHPEVLSHLSDEEAGQQMWDVLQKVAAGATEERYKSQGWDKGVTIHGETKKASS